MNRFNLTFWGEILAGRDPQKVKTRFGKMFSIDDPERLEHFFSGDTIILRRNLERKVAAEYYSKLRKLGVEVELVKVDATASIVEEKRRTVTPSTVADTDTDTDDDTDKEAKWERARRIAEMESQQRKAERAAEREQARRAAQATAAKRRAEQEALKQQLAEAETRRAQQEKIRLQQQAEADARHKAELAALRQKQNEEAARRKAAREEEKHKAAEEIARRKAELAEQKRVAQEKADAEKMRLAQEKRKAEEAAARQRALEDEQRRQEEQARKEQAAREKAQREEEKRKAEEAAAKQRALEAQQRRKEEQARKKQAAREKSRREKEKQKAAEAAAKQKAQEAERRRKKEQARREQAALEQARLQEEQRKAEEAAAKQRALEAEQRHKKEQAHREQTAREKAEREAEAARLREEQAAARREEKARREAQRAKLAQERAEQRAERQRRAAAEKQRLEEERRLELEREREQAEQRRLMEEQAIARAADELSDMSALRPAQAKVKSSLDLPRRDTGKLPPTVKRQAGAPNFYSMHPFRNTNEIRERAARASKSKFSGLAAATLALAALMVLTGRYVSLVPEVPVTGPADVVAAPTGALLIRAGGTLLLHDRSGMGVRSVGPEEAGVQLAPAPITYEASGNLLLHANSTTGAVTSISLYRCAADLISCAVLHDGTPARDMAAHPLTGQVFLVTGTDLIKLSAEGELLARSEPPLPNTPVLQLDSGLLFMNSAQGPAISVYRYEDSAFGKQLDEVLLLPPPAVEKGQASVRDFARAGRHWWVSLHNPEDGSTGLYLFDSDWSYLQEISVDEAWREARLTNWGQKILLWRPDSAVIKRFAANGNVEADLVSGLLASLMEQQQKGLQLKNISWATVFSLLIVIAAVGAARGYHQYLRSLVYHSRPSRGAESFDESTADIHWIDPVADLAPQMKRLWLSYSAIALALILVCIGLGASVWQLTAALVALSGPGIALALFSRSTPAHIGTLEDQLILVDHRDMYHMASGARIQYRGPFLLIDDVLVFTGDGALPALSQEHLIQWVKPVAQAGARVDRKTILVKLLEAQHPLARGATAIAIALLAATVIFAAGQLL